MAMITSSDLVLFVLDLGKATFDNTCDSVGTLQHKVEEATLALARDIPGLPRTLVAVLDEWVGLSRRTRGDLKATVDRCYVLLRAGAEGADDEADDEAAAAPRHRARPSARHLRAA